ncbi:MAG: methylenetetrahydrofolate reductase [Alphaproteobacteria bacterium]|nr:methylenetetrahydrofolate reductase [Alphaproteobacteria bacterium]MDE2043061.1 methylenetetrahydrofolate reductase [Alphaproteobacteria bacterium]MDE2339852.1 methylenetetrahydrofolate reductase [Alphaproteobacteria bacterium]
MSAPLIHPNWEFPPKKITDGFSLEMTAKDGESLKAAAALVPADTPIAITFLPGEEAEARVAAARLVRQLGFEPMPHFSARRITSEDDFEGYIHAVVAQAGVQRCFIVAGDPPTPQGPYDDTTALLTTGAFERAGIKAIGIGGHPEGHPVMSAQQCWDVLDTKITEIERRGMAPLIVTQFSFDPDVVLDWLKALRARGIDAPVRIGIPGPAGIKRLLRFAAHCGVASSTSVMKKYGVSMSNLLGSAGPEKLVASFAVRLGDEHGKVRLHFYPFGGLEKTAAWIRDFVA